MDDTERIEVLRIAAEAVAATLDTLQADEAHPDQELVYRMLAQVLRHPEVMVA